VSFRFYERRFKEVPRVPQLEKDLGIEVYATRTKGIGGVIRFSFDDFVVEEVLLDNSRATVSKERNLSLKISLVPVAWKKYLICVMVKRGWDTLLAVRRIAQQLGVDFNAVKVAGIKDAKALTAQHISLRNVHPEELEIVRLKDLTLNPIKYSHRTVSPHLLLGNHFNITIRNITHSKTEVKERISETWKQLETLGGIPNFFGHQRFGTTRPITHKVGKALVKGNVEEAAMLFLAAPSPFEHEISRKARRRLSENQDFKTARDYFPKHLKYERLMLGHLAEHPRDFVGAFRKLPLQLRRLFVQAYQSYLFNRFLSQRIKQKIPLNQPQIGDFAVWVDKYGLPTSKHEIVREENFTEIEAAIEKGKMRIALPLPGYRQNLSGGVQGEIEQSILEEDKVSCMDFRISGWKEISLKGSLRTCVTIVQDFSFTSPREDSANPSKRMVTLRFMLLRGSYATIVLREFMKPQNVIDAGF
jgi:tRNA pseudouridine13 synthase